MEEGEHCFDYHRAGESGRSNSQAGTGYNSMWASLAEIDISHPLRLTIGRGFEVEGIYRE